MATSGTPNAGLDEIALRTYINGTDMTLVAYTNTADSLGAATLVSNLVQPTEANGYAPIVMDGTWSSTDGVVTYTHSTSTHPGWTATDTWSATVTGTALIFGATVVHFKDVLVPFVAASGKTLIIDMTTLVI